MITLDNRFPVLSAKLVDKESVSLSDAPIAVKVCGAYMFRIKLKNALIKKITHIINSL